MRGLLRYFKGYRAQAVLAPLFKMIEVVFELLVPLVVADIIDKGIPASDKGYILKMCGVLVLFGLCGLMSTLTAQYFSAKASVGFTGAVRQALFDHIQSLPFSDYDNLGSSTLITRLTSDLNQVQTGVNLTLRLLMRSPLVVIGATIMALRIDFNTSLVFIAVIPILAAVVFGIMLGTIPLYSAVQKKLDAVLLKTKENLSGARVIRAFCMEDSEISGFDEKNSSLAHAQKFVGRISSVMNPLTYSIINVAIAALIYSGALKVQAGILTQGLVIALYNYMSQILIELIKLANLIISITKSLACAKRVNEIFGVKPSQKSGTAFRDISRSDYTVEFKNVSFRYRGAAADSLEGINISIKKGENIGIIGSTGSGKTTLISLIPRFYDATRGEVLVGGLDVKDWDEVKLRDTVSVVMQKSSLFSGSIRDNLRFGDENAGDETVMDAVALAQAKNVVESKPDGLDHMIEQGGKNLSGGQIQRMMIARALVKKPEILILDDSSSALDFATDAALRKAISLLDYSPTVITVSQRISSVMHSDRVLMLEDGEAVGIGTHEELLNSCPEYAELYRSQIKSSQGGAVDEA